MSASDFDLIVIGAGSGGVRASATNLTCTHRMTRIIRSNGIWKIATRMAHN